MKFIDLPPVWTLLCFGSALAIDALVPTEMLGSPGKILGALLVLVGGVIMALAAYRMRLVRTTVIPRRDPSALVTDGVFRYSRNPIYLGDAMALTGAILWIDAAPALLLVPLFIAVIQRRFILGEEQRLRSAFGPAFAEWSRTTRRWL